jgi:hypothetical protein
MTMKQWLSIKAQITSSTERDKIWKDSSEIFYWSKLDLIYFSSPKCKQKTLGMIIYNDDVVMSWVRHPL